MSIGTYSIKNLQWVLYISLQRSFTVFDPPDLHRGRLVQGFERRPRRDPDRRHHRHLWDVPCL